MSGDYLRKRRQLRLNLFLAMCFLIGGAILAAVYGVVYLVNLWVLGDVALAVASGAAAYTVAFLLIAMFGVIYRRLRRKLAVLEKSAPLVVES